MGIKTEIEFRKVKLALRPPDIVYSRVDRYQCSVIQTRKNEEVHVIAFNSTSTLKRAKKWCKLSKRKFLWEMYKSWGLITLIKFLME